MTFRRGFKTEANELALEVREELGLRAESPLCPFSLAQRLEIKVVSLVDLCQCDPELAGKIAYFVEKNPSAFSAVTVCHGTRRLVVHNHRHSLERRRANVAHELAHALLQHPPHPPFCSDGDRTYDRNREEEAGWLGPVLLVTNEGAHWAMRRGMSSVEAAGHFEVSEELMEFRYRMSGAQRIQSRMARKRA